MRHPLVHCFHSQVHSPVFFWLAHPSLWKTSFTLMNLWAKTIPVSLTFHFSPYQLLCVITYMLDFKCIVRTLRGEIKQDFWRARPNVNERVMRERFPGLCHDWCLCTHCHLLQQRKRKLLQPPSEAEHSWTSWLLSADLICSYHTGMKIFMACKKKPNKVQHSRFLF